MGWRKLRNHNGVSRAARGCASSSKNSPLHLNWPRSKKGVTSPSWWQKQQSKLRFVSPTNNHDPLSLSIYGNISQEKIFSCGVGGRSWTKFVSFPKLFHCFKGSFVQTFLGCIYNLFRRDWHCLQLNQCPPPLNWAH